MTAPTTTYTLVEEPLRIDALDAQGVAICGAYQPKGHDYWCLFVTKTVTQITGLAVPPGRELYGPTGRTTVKAWVELLATLAMLAKGTDQ